MFSLDDLSKIRFLTQGWCSCCQESWEIGARYVRQRSLFEANNDIVSWLI